MFKRMSLFLVAVFVGVMSCAAEPVADRVQTLLYGPRPDIAFQSDIDAAWSNPKHYDTVMVNTTNGQKMPSTKLNQAGYLAWEISFLEREIAASNWTDEERVQIQERIDGLKKEYEAAFQPTKWQRFKECVKACNLYMKCAAAVGLLLEQAL